MLGIKDTSPETLWADPESLVKDFTILLAINRGGVGIDTKSPVYALSNDPLGIPGCLLCLCRGLDGSPVTIRHKQSDIKLAETPEEYKILNYLHTLSEVKEKRI